MNFNNILVTIVGLATFVLYYIALYYLAVYFEGHSFFAFILVVLGLFPMCFGVISANGFRCFNSVVGGLLMSTFFVILFLLVDKIKEIIGIG
jgi:hypothetical protein